MSRSSLLRSICECVPHHPGAVTRLQVAVPVSGPTLLTIQELLYTGQVSRTRPELVAVSQGLAALGIDNFSQLPTAAGVQQQTPGAGPAVAGQQFLGRTSGLGTAASPGTMAAAELLVHRLDPAKITVKIKRNEDVNKATNDVSQDNTISKINTDDSEENTKQDMVNNNVFKHDKKSEKVKNRKRKRLSEGNLNPKTDEIELEGSPVTEEVAGGARRPAMMRLQECEDCGQQLRSAWHRHPTRHSCVRRDGEGEGGAGVRCPECGAALRSAWFLPPSRHACSAATNPGKRRKRLSRDTKAASVSKQEKLEQEAEDADGSADGFVTPRRSDAEEEGQEDSYFSCPLKQCSRKCETKKLLMLHLAMSHFFKKMEAKYITEEGGGYLLLYIDLINCCEHD